MAGAKDIEVRVVPSKIANTFVDSHHYSGKHVNNSVLHFGVFIGGKLHGAMSYGPPLDKAKALRAVPGTGWNECLELNRMVFDDALPRNSESRAISVTLKLIRKNAPHIKWVQSYADGCSCGDGTIYRASGFELIGINKNKNLVMLPDEKIVHKFLLESSPTKPRPELGGKTYFDMTGGKYSFGRFCKAIGIEPLEGYQLRYIYFIDRKFRNNLAVPTIPFSRIDEIGAGMYKGQRRGCEQQ